MKRCVVFLFVVLTVFWVPPVFGQDGETVEVPPITVTYTRGEQDPQKIPAAVTIIDRQIIDRSGAATIPDLLRSEAGINIQSLTGNNLSTSLDMRGFGRGLDTLVMINGVRLNNADLSSVEWSLIPLSAVERIEITKGPGSVLWGDSALAGVVNIITRAESETPRVELKTVGGSDARFDETLGFSYGGDWGRLALTAGYSYTDGYRDNGSYNGSNVSLSAGFTPTDVFELTIDAGYDRETYGLPGYLWDREIAALGRRATMEPSNSGDGERFYVNAGMGLDFGSIGRLELDYSYRDRAASMDNWNERFGTYLVAADNTLGEHGVSGKYIWEIDREIIDNRLTLGIDYRNISYRQKMYNAPAWGLEANVGYRDVKREAVAYFFYNELTLADLLVVSVGYRGEITNQDWTDRAYNVFDWGSGSYVDTYLAGSEKYRNEAYTAGLTLLYGDENKAYFRFSTGYRIPVIDEQVQYNGFNPLVRPERSVTYELGVKHFLTPDISVALDLYYARYTDEIYVNPFTLENISFERTIHRGVELSVNARLLDWLIAVAGLGLSGRILRLLPVFRQGAAFDSEKQRHVRRVG